MVINDKLMPIGEVAKCLRVTRRMILHYEEIGLVTPDVKEGPKGNRYYTVDSLTRIRSIRVLQDLGLSLSEIHSYFNDTTDLAPLIKRLEALRDQLNMSIEKLRARVDYEDPSLAKRIVLPRQTVYRRAFRAETLEKKKEFLRAAYIAASRTYGLDITRRLMHIEYPLADPQACFCCISIPEESAGEFVCTLPETSALCVTWHGGYSVLPEVRERMLAWAAQEQIALAGTCRHIYLEGPPQHKDESKFITQVVLPICSGQRK